MPKGSRELRPSVPFITYTQSQRTLLGNSGLAGLRQERGRSRALLQLTAGLRGN